MATQTLVTPEQFDSMSEDEGRFELLDGELIEMSSNLEHNGILGNVTGEFRDILRKRKTGIAIPETEFQFGQDRFRPDLVVLSAESWAKADLYRIPVRNAIPEIAVEIVSPSDRVSVLERKIRVYLAAGILEVWVLFPESRDMYVHTAAGRRFVPSDGVLETPVLPGWSVPASNFFALP